jgi:hypothetical protein
MIKLFEENNLYEKILKSIGHRQKEKSASIRIFNFKIEIYFIKYGRML